MLSTGSFIAVNSEVFARVLFSRNFADAEFHENKTLAQRQSSLSFTDVGISCQSRKFLTWQICLLSLLVKIKFYRKFPNLQYYYGRKISSHLRSRAASFN